MTWNPFSSSATRPTSSDLDDADDSPPSGRRGIPVESAEIVMVSLPSSESGGSSPHESYQTPPEDSLPAISEEQRQAPPADDAQSRPHSGGVGPGVTEVVDEACADTGRAVDLGKDSDNLGFSAVMSTLVIDGSGVVFGVGTSRGVEDVVATEVLDSEVEKFVVSPREPKLASDGISSKPASKKLKLFGNSLEPCEPLAAHALGNHQVNEDMPLKETEVEAAFSKGEERNKHGKGDSAVMNIEDLDKFKYVGSSSSVGQTARRRGVSGKRELPASISGQVRNAGTDKQILLDLLEVLKMVEGETDVGADEDSDFLETAKKQGMTFPRPRWWPPEGLDD